jgi:uncharacterized protein
MPTHSPAYHSLPASIKMLVQLVIKELSPDEIILFGSRARGDHRDNSDFDIAVKAASIPASTWARLLLALDEAPITLHRVDLVDFNQLTDDYKKRISSEGKTLYAS